MTARNTPDRIRGFTGLTDHEESTYDGKIVVSEYDGSRFRRIWHDGQWWHSVVDVVGALTESVDGRKYWNKLKQRLVEEGSEVVTDCHQLKLPAPDGKLRETDCASTETLFRIIQSIPSPKAEPVKQFLAQAGAERLEEIAQPSRAVDRAIRTYRDKGREDEWIDVRLQNISARNELTDEWKERGVETPGKIAGLTKDMSSEMLGVTPAEHKKMKEVGKRDDLRDHMDKLELAVTTLGEQAAKAIVVARDARVYAETRGASLDGAKVAGDAARRIEAQIGRPIANGSNFLAKTETLAALPPAENGGAPGEH